MQHRVAHPPLFSLWQHIRSFASKIQVEYAAIPPHELAMRQKELDQASPLPPALPTNYIGLLAAIRSSANLDQLETLCTSPQTAPHFDVIHTSAALSRLPKVMRFRSKDLEKTDVVIASSLSPPETHSRQGLSPLGEAGPLTLAPGSIPRRGYSERASALTHHLLSSLSRAKGREPHMFPRQSANCIWALGTLHSMGVSIVDEPITDNKKKRRGQGVKYQLPSYPEYYIPSPSHLSNPRSQPRWISDPQDGIEATIGRMAGANMSSEFITGYTSMLQAVCGNDYSLLFAHAQPCEVAQMLKGLTLLPRGCQHRGLIRALSAYVAERARVGGAIGFGHQELRTCAWAIASLADSRWTPSPVPCLSSSDQGGINEASHGLSPSRRNFSGSLVSSSALLSIADRLIHDPSKIYESLSPGGLSSLMWSYAACHDPSGTRPAVHQEVLTRLFDLLSEGIRPQSVLLKPQDVSMVLWACSKIGYELKPDLLSLLAAKAVVMVEAFRPLELARTLEAFRTMNLPQAPLLSAVARSLLSEQELDITSSSPSPSPSLSLPPSSGEARSISTQWMRDRDRDGQGPGLEALSQVLQAYASGGLDEVEQVASSESKSRSPKDQADAGMRARVRSLAAMRRLRREVVSPALRQSTPSYPLSRGEGREKVVIKWRDQSPETLARLSRSLLVLINEERRLAAEHGEGVQVEVDPEHEETLGALLSRAESLFSSCTIPQLSILLSSLPSKSTQWTPTAPREEDNLPRVTSTMYAAAITHLKILIRAMLQNPNLNTNQGQGQGGIGGGGGKDLSQKERSKDEWIEPWVSSRISPKRQSSASIPTDHLSLNLSLSPDELWARGAGSSRGALLSHAVSIMTTCKVDGGMNDQELTDAVQSLLVASCGAAASGSSFSIAALNRFGLNTCLGVLGTCVASKDGTELTRSVKRVVAQAALSLSSAATPPHLIAALLSAYSADSCNLAESFNSGSDPSRSQETIQADLVLSMRVVRSLVQLFVTLRSESSSDVTVVSALNDAIRAACSFSALHITQSSEINLQQLMKDLDGLSRE